MLGPSASLVIIVYGERHSHAWAPSALFSFMIVVKLREAAFGSLGLKRLCSRTCLVLICCTQSSINILRTVHSLMGYFTLKVMLTKGSDLGNSSCWWSQVT